MKRDERYPLRWLRRLGWLIAWMLAVGSVPGAEVFRVGTFNLEMYIDAPALGHGAKTDAAKAKVRESLRAMNADVVAVEEMGGAAALEELRTALKAEGLHYPYFEHVQAHDPTLHVAVLSKFPIEARRSATNIGYLLNGRRFFVNRGFAELDIRVSDTYSFTLFAAHLKSKRLALQADEQDIREEEARLLRERIDAALAGGASRNVIVLGDFNDHRDSRTLRTLVGRGKSALVDTRPAETTGGAAPGADPSSAARNVVWTHYFEKQDTYSRLDYILVSKGMAREWDPAATRVVTVPDWGLASDHRPIVAAFRAVNE